MANSESENAGLEAFTNELSSLTSDVRALKTEQGDTMRSMANELSGLKASDGETRAKVEAAVNQLTETTAALQAIQERQRELTVKLESPIFKGDKELADSDRRAAISLQRQMHNYRGLPMDEFVSDEDNLVDAKAYRSAALKLTRAGIDTREQIARKFTAEETRAFEASGLSQGFIVPEMLGYVQDCNVECASLIDLYGQISVSRSQFRYLKIDDYGAMGSYACPASCDAELGPEGNMRWLSGNTHDWRGVFCLNREVVNESSVDLYAFIIDGAQRSYRINRNRAYITGDGVNQPQGWLSGDVFRSVNTRKPSHLDYVDVREFLGSIPREYGNVLPVMHQNTFAYLVSMVDGVGRFAFGEGRFGFMPEDLVDSLRISNCLPDPTNGLTIGNDNFVSGDFVMAAAAWDVAYKAVNQTPLFFEQWIGGSTAWCVKYQFGAKDGGFVGCANAGRILRIQ